MRYPLPLRLLPHRRPTASVLVVAGCVALFGLVPLALGLAGAERGYVTLWAGAWMVAAAGAGIGAFVWSRPGSPLYYLEVAADAVTYRSGLTMLRFAWPALGPFTVGAFGDAPQFFVRAARRAGPLSGMAFAINVSDFASDADADSADRLAGWLNALRSRALEHPAQAGEDTVVPAGFRAVAERVDPERTSAAGTSAARQAPRHTGVVEHR